MEKNAEKTRQRILDAALAEFSHHGVAGARVDRIAASAKCNKQMIYAYFGSKERLFDIVYAELSAKVVDSVEFDAYDLPKYVEDLCRIFEERPEVLRLAVWRRLEGADTEPEYLHQALVSRINQIQEAQEAGILTRRFSPEEILALVGSISMTGALTPARLGKIAVAEKARREVIVEAVRLLIAPPPVTR